MKLVVAMGLVTLLAQSAYGQQIVQGQYGCVNVQARWQQCIARQGQANCGPLQQEYFACSSSLDQTVRSRVQQMDRWGPLPMQNAPSGMSIPPTPNGMPQPSGAR